MLTLDLPPIRPAGPAPAFVTAASCKSWMATLPLTNIPALLDMLSQELESLSHFELSPLERLKILEQVREEVAHTATETAKRFHNKPVPFSPLEQAAWNNTQKLWHTLGQGYQQCLQALLDGDVNVSSFPALITQRVIACLVAQMLGDAHSFRPVLPRTWRQLHQLHAFAEEQGFADKRIKDPLNRSDGANSCQATYAKALLVGLADPQRLSSRQILMLDRWLDRWAAKSAISRERPPTPSLPLIVVDLEGESGAALLNGQALKEPRYLDSEELSISVRKRIKFLRGGGTPAQAGLGEDCVQPGCEAFLTNLYQRWCEPPPSRAHERQAAGGQAEIGFAFPAIFFFLSDGTPFKQPGDTLDVAPEIMEDMRVFGRVTERTERLLVARLGFSLENWGILDKSPGGYRLARAGAGERVGQNQMVALRPAEGGNFTLAVVRWLVLNEDGSLNIGTRALPGTPTAVAARTVTLNPKDAGLFSPAFLLFPQAGEPAPDSLILPVGWFQAGKLLHLYYRGQIETVKLTGLLEKGANFDQVTYVVTESA